MAHVVHNGHRKASATPSLKSQRSIYSKVRVQTAQDLSFPGSIQSRRSLILYDASFIPPQMSVNMLAYTPSRCSVARCP